MLANSAATLPKGHALVETYLFEQIGRGNRLHGSLTYLLYGISDRFMVGMKPLFGMTTSGGHNSPFGTGDLTVVAQYRLTSPKAAWNSPAVAISLQRSLPIGRYDKLDTRPAAGLGSGAPATIVALYAQQLFVLPDGRPFRTRLNLSRTFNGHADLDGRSVYGTDAGFTGRARPGDQLQIGVSAEYSVTRRLVFALDAVYDRSNSTIVEDRTTSNVRQYDGSESLSLAPAVEYSWRSNIGVLFGTRFRLRGKNAAPTITPAVAINYVY